MAALVGRARERHVLGELLHPFLGHLDGLPAAHPEALEAAFGLTEAAAPDLFLIALATLGLLGDAAARSPLVLIAEDAQWLDRRQPTSWCSWHGV